MKFILVLAAAIGVGRAHFLSAEETLSNINASTESSRIDWPEHFTPDEQSGGDELATEAPIKLKDALYKFEGLRFYWYELRQKDLEEISKFRRFLTQRPKPTRSYLSRASWWREFARRLPDCLVGVEVQSMPEILREALNDARVTPGLRLGTSITEAIHSEFFLEDERLNLRNIREVYRQTMLDAMLSLPPHVLTVIGVRELSRAMYRKERFHRYLDVRVNPPRGRLAKFVPTTICEALLGRRNERDWLSDVRPTQSNVRL